MKYKIRIAYKREWVKYFNDEPIKTGYGYRFKKEHFDNIINATQYVSDFVLHHPTYTILSIKIESFKTKNKK